MGDLKPIGSEKLNGDDKLKRILELTYYNQSKTSKKSNNVELVKESAHGMIYGIVKEKDGYYVKKGLNEQSLDYIGGLFMKNKNRFKSYNEALKRLELLKGQEQLSEAKKYVLKQTKTEDVPPSPSMPMDLPAPTGEPSAPTGDIPAPSGEPPMPEPSADSEMSDDMSATEPSPESGPSKKSDYMAEVQKYAGKLGQELRDQHEKMESDDIKYVLNMIISAVNLDKLDDEDIEEIGDKFSREDEKEEFNVPDLPPSDETPTDSESVPEPSGEESPEELSEDGDMLELDNFIKSEVDFGDYVHQDDTNEESNDLDKYSDMYEADEQPLDVTQFGFKELDEVTDEPTSSMGLDEYGDTSEDLSDFDLDEFLGDPNESETSEEKTVTLDLDELKSQINKSVEEILGKHLGK